MTWRVGTKIPINVYEGDRPICQAINAIGCKPAAKGCYCKPGKCMAPTIMGRQMDCRDPHKAAMLVEAE